MTYFSRLVSSKKVFCYLLLYKLDEQLVEVVFKRTAVHGVILRSKSPKTVSFKETGPLKRYLGFEKRNSKRRCRENVLEHAVGVIRYLN